MHSIRHYLNLLESSFVPRDVGSLLTEADQGHTSLPVTDDMVRNVMTRPDVVPDLFKNRDLADGKIVTVRLNLNSMFKVEGRPFFLQTVHDGSSPKGRVLGYDTAVTLRNATFAVHQGARSRIARKMDNKNPMAGVVGQLAQVAPVLSGTEIRFNPMTEHLFVTLDGNHAVESAVEITVFNTRVYARGKIKFWREDEAPKPRDEVVSNVKYHPGDDETA